MKRKPKPRTMWMVRGSACLAPFYGIALTKASMIDKLKQNGRWPIDASIVRVTVSETDERL